MSLAGAQEKLPVAWVDGAVAIPMNGAPSTHILKPDNPASTEASKTKPSVWCWRDDAA